MGLNIFTGNFTLNLDKDIPDIQNISETEYNYIKKYFVQFKNINKPIKIFSNRIVKRTVPEELKVLKSYVVEKEKVKIIDKTNILKTKSKDVQELYIFETDFGKLYLIKIEDRYFVGTDRELFHKVSANNIISMMQQNYEIEIQEEQINAEEFSVDGMPEESETMWGYLDITVDNFNFIHEQINKPEFNSYVQKYDYSNNWGAGFKYLIKGQGEERRNIYLILNKDKEYGVLVFKNLMSFKIAKGRGFFDLLAFGKEGKALSMNLLSWSKICPDDMETN